MKRLLGVVAVACAIAATAIGSIAIAGGPPKGKTGDLWKASHFNSDPIYSLSGIDLALLDLPKGSFLLQAKLMVQNSTAGADFDCWIRNAGGTLDDGIVTTAAAFDEVEIPLLYVYTQATAGPVFLRCSSFTTGSVAKNWTFAALKVGTVR